MNTENQSAVSDATEQTEPEGKVIEQETSFADALLATAKEEGHEVGDAPETATPPSDEPTEQPEAISAEPDEKPEPKDDEKEEKAEETAPTTERKSIDDQIAEAKAKGEKAPWYLSRIVEERDKKTRENEARKEAESQLERIRQENQALQAQLQQASSPKPTPDAPLIDINDEPGLQKMETHYETILKFTELNRDGATDVLVGKNKDGSEVRRDFTPEQVAELHYGADKALRKDIPQRRAFIAQRAQADAAALELYPQLQKADDPMTQQVAAILQQVPMLQAVLGPEVVPWIAHALRGREITLAEKNGNGANGSATTQKIVKAAKTQIAPTPTRTRSITERRPSSVNLDKTAKTFEARGDKESAEAYVDALLAPTRSGPKTVETIQE